LYRGRPVSLKRFTATPAIQEAYLKREKANLKGAFYRYDKKVGTDAEDIKILRDLGLSRDLSNTLQPSEKYEITAAPMPGFKFLSSMDDYEQANAAAGINYQKITLHRDGRKDKVFDSYQEFKNYVRPILDKNSKAQATASSQEFSLTDSEADLFVELFED
jgi:hypothetical protein